MGWTHDALLRPATCSRICLPCAVTVRGSMTLLTRLSSFLCDAGSRGQLSITLL
jgi:hypothetical protein